MCCDVFYKGEKRTISVRVSSCDDEPFVIRDASYTFYYGEETVSEGIPVVDENVLSMIFEPTKAGRYVLECRMSISGDRVIRRIPIHVRD